MVPMGWWIEKMGCGVWLVVIAWWNRAQRTMMQKGTGNTHQSSMAITLIPDTVSLRILA